MCIFRIRIEQTHDFINRQFFHCWSGVSGDGLESVGEGPGRQTMISYYCAWRQHGNDNTVGCALNGIKRPSAFYCQNEIILFDN